MKFNHDFLDRYIEVAPSALAIERSLECELLAEQPFERPILDIGCGDGIFASVLCAQRIDTGVDFDPDEIERARTHDRYDELINCGGNAVPKAGSSYRTIFANSVLEHIPNLLPVLKEANRLLAPGGRFYVTIPTDRWERATLLARPFYAVGLTWIGARCARAYNSFWKHYHAYPESQWIALFEAAGFTVAERRVYAPSNTTTLCDALTLFAAPSIITKKALGRWITIPPLRKALAPLILMILRPMIAASRQQRGGNLLFLALVK